MQSINTQLKVFDATVPPSFEKAQVELHRRVSSTGLMARIVLVLLRRRPAIHQELEPRRLPKKNENDSL